MVTALAVPAFALTWWSAAYLVGRDPARRLLWRTAGALVAYALATAAWTIAPAGPAAELLLCLPALVLPGALVALLPDGVDDRRLLDRGWVVLALLLPVPVVVLPPAGRLVVLAPLAGGVALVWRFGTAIRPRRLAVPVTAAAVLYGLGLTAVLLPVDLGSPVLVRAAMGLDLLALGYLAAAADAVDAGERLHPDLRRSALAATAAALLCGGPATLTVLAVPGQTVVAVLQFLIVAVVMTGVALAGPVRRGLDRVAFPADHRLRRDRSVLLGLAEALPRRSDRRRLGTLPAPEFRRLVQRAYEHYADPARLARSPLTDLPAVDRRLAGRDPGLPLARAVELRAVLREHVARLKPDGGFGTTEEWRAYNALHYGWVVGLRPYARRPRSRELDRDEVRALEWFRQHVPRRSMRRWQRDGVRLVADRLWAELRQSDQRRPVAARSTRDR